MNAILLAGGCGTRLKPITNTIPKCMVSINGKPLIDYWLETLLENPKPLIHKVLINTHHLPEIVREHIHKSKWKRFISLVHEEVLLGTGGTILKNRDFFLNQAFFVAHADNLTKFSLEDFIKAHKNRASKVEITAMTFNTDSPKSCGIIVINKNNLVTSFIEKPNNPKSNLANGAVYIFEPSVITFIASLKKDEIDISRDILPNYVGKMDTFHNETYHRDIGTLESLLLAEQDCRNKVFY
ncbi:MAG: nucleotidyltransferase family protein [Candidatus Staskawiczbacteria bacterium]|nr:nucleotidyltransferase family protein [Candidatus Staskawiczbacteria bacterium]